MNVPAKPETLHRDCQDASMDRDEQKRVTTSVLCFGEALWDLSTEAGKSFETTTHLTMTPGGGAVNVARHLRALGENVALAGSVGADAVGRALKARVGAMGIDVSRVLEAKPRTGLIFMTNAPLQMVGYRSTKEEALAWKAALPRTFGATIFHASGLLPSRAFTTSLVATIKRARREGCLVSLDANVRPKLWTAEALDRVGLSRVFAEVDVLKLSDDDLHVLGFSKPKELAQTLRAETNLVVTHGARGASALGPSGEIHVKGEALEINSAIGAGDAFVAGMLSVLAHDKTALPAALSRGNEHALVFLKDRT